MADDPGKYLVFRLGDRCCAFSLEQVAEVIEPPTVWPVPCAPRCYTGAMNFHGTIVAVIDLPCFLGQAGSVPGEKVIVLAPAVAALAFQVDRVVRITPAEFTPRQDAAPSDPFATGSLSLAEGEVIVLDACRLAALAGEAAACR